MIRQIRTALKTQGLVGLLRAVSRKVFHIRARCFPLCAQRLAGKRGLEIGGPSGLFRRAGLLPAYPLVAGLDNCNFGRKTVWEGAVREGRTFRYDARAEPGTQYIAEATDLGGIPPGQYEFVLSSHTLEHVANPIKALVEWQRVLIGGGTLVLVVPHRDGTFDHRRPVTPLEHLFKDYENQTGEDDLTHLPEVLELHDLRRDPGTSDRAAFRARSEANGELRCLHHHVFDTLLAVRAVDHVGFRILAVELVRPYHILIVAEKAVAPGAVDNRAYLATDAAVLRQSPFPSDRRLAAS